VQDLLALLADGDSAVPWVQAVARPLLTDGGRRVLRYTDGRGIVLIGRRGRRVRGRDGDGTPEEFTDIDDASWMTRPVSLRVHSDGVRRWTLRFAQACGLPKELAIDLGIAAWLHDCGKADPRFQVMLHRGDEAAAALVEEPLAKSGMDPRDRAALRRARVQSGYPAGYLHESASLALVTSNEAVVQKAHDPELVLHLVASHHGGARPFLPAVHDLEPQEICLQHGDQTLTARSDHGLDRLDSGVSDRFWRLVRRYGWHGLAYLEAILRLADHGRSEEEQTSE
jgi:CRISPR-associated endonuclease/helicase Cas3